MSIKSAGPIPWIRRFPYKENQTDRALLARPTDGFWNLGTSDLEYRSHSLELEMIGLNFPLLFYIIENERSDVCNMFEFHASW